MVFWLDIDNNPITDASGKPIWCDECPCEVDPCYATIAQWRAYCENFGSSEAGQFLMEAAPSSFPVASLPFFGEPAIWRKYNSQYQLEWKRNLRALWVAVDFRSVGENETYEDSTGTCDGPGFAVKIAVRGLDCDCLPVIIFETDTAFYTYSNYQEEWVIRNYPEVYFTYGNAGSILSLLGLSQEELPEGFDPCECNVMEWSDEEIAVICEQGPEESCLDNYVAHLVSTWTNDTGEDVSVHFDPDATGCVNQYSLMVPIDNAALLKLSSDPMPRRGWEADRNILDLSVPAGKTVQLYCLNGPSDDEIGKGTHPWYIAGTLSYRALTCDACAIKIEAALIDVSDALKTGPGYYNGTAYRAAYLTVKETIEVDQDVTVTLYGWDCGTCTLAQLAQISLRNDFTQDRWTHFPQWTDDPSACDPEENPDADE